MLLLLFSLNIIVSPEPIKCMLNNPVSIEIKVIDENNNTVQAKINLSISPQSLGKLEGFTFIPEKEGKGVLNVVAEYNGKFEKKLVFISVEDTVFEIKKIIPDFVILNAGDNVYFKTTGGNVSVWKVVPQNIGDIDNNGNFRAKEEGKGRIVAIFDDGSVLSARIIIGKDEEKIKILPSFVKLNIGERFIFRTEKTINNVVWSVIPDDLGRIENNGEFFAEKSGRGMILVKGEINGKKVLGKSIIVVKGELSASIFPKKVFLKPEERAKFTLKDQNGNEIKPIKWKVIPERMGNINDGVFTPSVNMGRGKIVALLDKKYKQRVLYADFVITPDKAIGIILRPRFHKINIDEKIQFYVDFINTENIPVRFEVYPNDLGEINSAGIFTPKRNGSGVIIARPINAPTVKPSTAFVIVGDLENLEITPKFIDVYENGEVKFNITSQIPEDAEILWIVQPQGIGSITKDGYFKVGKLPQNQNELYLKIIAIAHKRLQILSYGISIVRVRRR